MDSQRQPDPWRAGRQRLERPLRLHLLPPAVRVQPVRRSGTLCAASRQRPQRRRLARRAGAGRRALSGQGDAPLLPGRCRLRQSRRSTSSWKPRATSTRSGSRPTRFLQEQDRLSAQAPGRAPAATRCGATHASFSYQAGVWNKPRRVVAKVEWHPGELYPARRLHRHQPDAARPSGWSPSTTSAARPSSTSRRARTRSSGRGCHAGRSPPTPCGSSFTRSPTISATSCAPWRCPSRSSTGR